jgi:uncharacterized protein (TIGR02646 family)
VIRLSDTALSPGVARRLRGYQQDIDGLPDYAARVAEAKRLWPLRNKTANRTFQTVREMLADMCGKTRRCCYCEDSCADEIEHFRPKDIYPEAVFVWENYLFACGACNVEKRNDFRVFTSAGSVWSDVKRKSGDPIMPPPAGDPVLIDPRREDPLEFLLLDLSGTFTFHPLFPAGMREHERALYTIAVLGLNARDHLIQGRKSRFVAYRDILGQYAARKSSGDSHADLDHRKDAIKRLDHQTVWHEMKRWHADLPGRLPKLDALFTQAPEALSW